MTDKHFNGIVQGKLSRIEKITFKDLKWENLPSTMHEFTWLKALIDDSKLKTRINKQLARMTKALGKINQGI